MPSVSERQRHVAYWAGIFDGEGCVMLAVCQRAGCARPQVSLKVAVSNTHRGVIEELVLAFPPPSGRVINSYLGGPKDQVRRRQQYKWERSGMSAYRFLQMLLPYLIVKQEQAQLAIEFYERPWRTQREKPGGGWRIRSAEQVKIDLTYARQIKALKHAS